MGETLLNVLPREAASDPTYGCLSHTKAFGYVAEKQAVCKKLTYEGYVSFSEFGLRVARACVTFSLMVASTFSLFICHIFSVSAKKKVCRVYAGGSVTAMQNVKSRRYFTYIKGITNAVCKYLGFHTSFTYHTVTLIVFICRPQMATRRVNTDFSVKSLFKWFGGITHNIVLCFSRVFTQYNTHRVGG